VTYMKRPGATRRQAISGLGGVIAGSSLLHGQQDPFRDHTRIPAIDELVRVQDFEAVFFAKEPREVYQYTSYGTESEFTLRRNREVFEWVELVSRGAVDVGSVKTATELLGTQMAFPIMASPTSGHGQIHPEGEMATHRGTTAASNTPYIISNGSSFPVDKVAAAATGPMWFQLYPQKDIGASRELLEKAQAAGCKAVAMTMDQQSAFYERPLHDLHLTNATAATARLRPSRAAANPYRIRQDRLWYDWKYVDQIRPFLKVPLVGKGVLNAESAKLCLEHGLDGVYVSNHGGRSLDYAPSSLEVLPEIVDAVQGRVPIMIDSGFRCGSDILKALALGAKVVCIGRGARWGLGAYGAAGVQRVFEILQAELEQAMAETGVSTLDAIDKTLVRTHFV
jgi:4-hydroxymandelate oxidase